MSAFFSPNVADLQNMKLHNPQFGVDVAIVIDPEFYTYRLQDDADTHSPPDSISADGIPGVNRWVLFQHGETIDTGTFVLEDAEQASISGGGGLISAYEVIGTAWSSLEGKVTITVVDDLITATNISGGLLTITLNSYIRK